MRSRTVIATSALGLALFGGAVLGGVAWEANTHEVPVTPVTAPDPGWREPPWGPDKKTKDIIDKAPDIIIDKLETVGPWWP